LTKIKQGEFKTTVKMTYYDAWGTFENMSDTLGEISAVVGD